MTSWSWLWRRNRRLLVLFAVASLVAYAADAAYSMVVSCNSGMSDTECLRYLNASLPATTLTATVALLPIALGLALGADAIAGEVEDRTSLFAWSISGRRTRWLVSRALPDILIVLGFGLLCGAVNAVVVARLNPGHPIATSFVSYGLWGPIIAIRGVCGYAIALFVGTLTGRRAPAIALALILVSITTVSALVIGRSFEAARIMPGGDPARADDMYVTDGFTRPDGTLVSWEECARAEPSFAATQEGADEQAAWSLANCPPVAFFIPGQQMVVVESRESAALLAIALVCARGAAAHLRTRRP